MAKYLFDHRATAFELLLRTQNIMSQGLMKAIRRVLETQRNVAEAILNNISYTKHLLCFA